MLDELQKEVYNKIYDLRRENKNPKFLVVDYNTQKELKKCNITAYQPDYGTGKGDFFMGLEVCTTTSEARTLEVF